MITSKALICSALILVAVTATAEETSQVCDHPVDYLPEDTELHRLHGTFDGKAERRIFSEVHYYPRDPHLTIGMGHCTYGNISSLFSKIYSNKLIWNEMLDSWLSILTPAMWKEFNADTNTSTATRSDFETGLLSLMCINGSSQCIDRKFAPWTHRTASRFNNEDNWFRAGWKKVGRIEAIAQIQVNHWNDTIVRPSIKAASEAGADTLGGIASFASARSSSTGISNSLARKLREVLMAPKAVQPLTEPVDQARLLEDWRSVVAWSEYVKAKKGDIRPRMIEIWRVYFEETWGKMPRRPDEIQNLRHSGCYMARGIIAVSGQINKTADRICRDIPPRAEKTACTK